MKKSVLTILIVAILSVVFAGCSETQETWRLGDYKGEYVGFRLEEEDSENPVIIIRFEFTNYSDTSISFMDALSPALYQEGSELIRREDSVDAAAMPVAPGESYSIDLSYYLLSKSELVEISINNTVTGESFSVKTHTEK